ncbi:MAG: 2TM domain-containing protein [Bacteroidota bacterium]
MYSKDEIKRAKKKVKQKKEFYQHLMSYVTVNFALIAINLLTSPWHYWFIYPMLGWGIGLMFHYTDVFGIPGFGMLDKEWEAREIEDELRKMREQEPPRLEEPSKIEMELKELRRNYDDSEYV